MKRVLFFLMICVAACHVAQADVSFDENKRYRFSCSSYASGTLVLGKYHNSMAYLYYDLSQSDSDDAWWYIRKEGKGYHIINAKDNTFITRSDERIPNVAKGLVLSVNPMGTDSQWQIVENDYGYVTVQSVSTPAQWWNLRKDGSYLLGTYPGTGSDNELFKIFDEDGNDILAGQSGSESTLHSMVDSLRIYNKQLVYDSSSKRYFCSLSQTLRPGDDYHTTLTCKLKDAYQDCVLSLDGQTPDAEGQITIENVDCGEAYKLALTNPEGKEVATAEVQFTFLPLVEVNVPSCNGSYYTSGHIRVTDANFPGHDSLFIAAYRYRGATAMSKDKKSYAIKLRDAAGNSVDRKYFGLRSDNNWILDAMAIDPACMRNRVSTDLWNDFSVAPYYKDRERKARTGTRGKFVEVFLNGKYHGLYCMTEKLDRKQLKLKKFVDASTSTSGENEVHGLLYKSSQWSYEVLMGHEQGQKYFPGYSPRNYSNQLGNERWAEFELKYPDYETEAVDWEPLYNAVDFVATSSQSNFERGVKDYFDYPVLRDYYLFIELLLTTDNHGKNMFYYLYDRQGPEADRISVAPWDLDGVWGCRWDGSYNVYGNPLSPKLDFETFLWDYEHGQTTLYWKLNKMPEWKDELAARYAQLRRTHFTADALKQRVQQYARLFADSHADEREADRWKKYHTDLQQAAEYMTEWIDERIETLDKKYGYDPVVEGVNQAVADNDLALCGGKQSLAIRCGKAQTVSLYNLSGTLVRRIRLNEGLNVINALSPGVYVVNALKVVVE